MLTREGLWRRVSGAGLWPAAWGLALACALPWVVPEGWDGRVTVPWAGAGVAVLAFGALCLRQRTWPLPFAALLLCLTAVGLGRLAREDQGLPTGLVRLEGTVASPWRVRPTSRSGLLRLTAPSAMAGQRVPVALPPEGLAPPPPGTPVRVLGTLEAVEPGPSWLGERPLWRARALGETRRIRLRSAAQLEVLGPPAPGLLLRLQDHLHRRLEGLGLTPLAREVWGALTLGISPASPETASVFTESGTLHVLVVSGMQVTLLMAVAEALLRKGLRRGTGWGALAVGVLYASVVGFSAPVWRGLLMGAAWLLSRSRGWALPPVLTLHGALLLWLLAHPSAGADPGFLLSWGALLGVVWAAEPLAALASPLLGPLALPLARLTAPWLTTLPLLALFHGGIPLLGIPANLLVLPAVAVLTPLCLLLTVLPLPGLVSLTGTALAWVAGGLLPRFALVQPIATAWVSPFLGLLAGWLMVAHRHSRLQPTRALVTLLTVVTVGLVASRGVGTPVKALTVEAVEVGHGDALLVRAPGSDALLVDTGGSPWAARRIARVLSRRGVREPLHLLVTHPHGDHAGGWGTLVRLWPLTSQRRSAVHPEAVWWDPLVAPEVWQRSRPVIRGAAWNLGPMACAVRWPPGPLHLADPNGTSAVLRLRWGAHEAWLMGDAETLQEQDLQELGEPGPGPAHRLLKPGHHGAANATSAAWLQALRPQVALVTAERHSSFGFPHPETLVRLEAAGCRVIRCGDTSGARVEATPTGWRVVQER